MRAFTTHTAIAAPLPRVNVDTDQIIPKQFLKRVERTGFGDVLFNDWRYRPDGSPNPDFELNDPRYAGAGILVAGRNFGCGSSREHAVWALDQYGFRAVIAPSFADIFYNNCLATFLPVTLPESDVAELTTRAQTHDAYTLTIDLEGQLVEDPHGFTAHFDIAAFDRHRLLNGLDDIALTLQHERAIAAFEACCNKTARPA